MCSRGLVNMVVDYIAAVVSKASLEGPLGLSNILLFTVIFVAFQHIYYIVAVACKFSVDLPCASIIDFLYSFPQEYKGKQCTDLCTFAFPSTVFVVLNLASKALLL